MPEGPFRHSGWHACPACAATLREFRHRLICDHCDGIFLGHDDLASAIGDQRGTASPELVPVDAKPVTARCPVCPDHVQECRLELRFEDGKKKTPKQWFLRCAQHGVWCGRGVLAALLAVIGTGRVSANRGRGGFVPVETMPTGLDGLPKSPGGSASDRLAISAWRGRRRQRAKTLSPVNAYAERALACPVCPGKELRFLGDRYACEGCSGIFVENPAVAAMVNEIAPSYWELAEARGQPGSRACPVCRELLVVDELETVSIDRCAAHGIWFDPVELATMLEHASGNVHEGGLRRWLARLFA